jgi:hypothetical protein
MISTTTFPSTEWFDALGKVMREDKASFEPLGSTDCTMVVQLDDTRDQKPIEVKFNSYEVESVRDLDSIDDANPDHFTITAKLEIWREMLDNIIDNGHPDLEHTLNFLTFPDDPIVVDGPDQLQIDTFFRYNQSLQLFFNGAAKVVTA